MELLKKTFARATTLQSGHFANSAVEIQFLDVSDSIGFKRNEIENTVCNIPFRLIGLLTDFS